MKTTRLRRLAGLMWQNDCGLYTAEHEDFVLEITTRPYHPKELQWTAAGFPGGEHTWTTGNVPWSMSPDGSLYDAALDRCATEAKAAAERLAKEAIAS